MELPSISILMAVYEPRMDWLREQLISLNNQTYPNLRLYVRDDCSKQATFEDILHLVNQCITAFPSIVMHNDENLGSNKTFERLTAEADGTYFAYCDQDDIWMPEKLTVLGKCITDAVMAYSDMKVIDREGTQTAESLKKIRPRLRYLEGCNLQEAYFFRNCTAGCSMLVRSSVAKKAIPFPGATVWDQWVATIAAANGRIAFTGEKLVSYRKHARNQTGVLIGIESKADYYNLRIKPLKERLEAYEKVCVPSDGLREFVHARINEKKGQIWKYRHFSPYEAMAEIVIGAVPERAFESAVKRIRRKDEKSGSAETAQ